MENCLLKKCLFWTVSRSSKLFSAFNSGINILFQVTTFEKHFLSTDINPDISFLFLVTIFQIHRINRIFINSYFISIFYSLKERIMSQELSGHEKIKISAGTSMSAHARHADWSPIDTSGNPMQDFRTLGQPLLEEKKLDWKKKKAKNAVNSGHYNLPAMHFARINIL